MTTCNHPTRTIHQAIGGDAATADENSPRTDLAPTVRSSHGLACPNCGNDESLFVTGFIQIELAPKRYIPKGCPQIREDHDIMCVACGNFGTVAEWRVSPSEDIMIIG